MIAAALEAKVAAQAVDAPFDACPPAIVPPPGSAVLQCSPLGGGVALPGHGHMLHPRLLERRLLPRHVKAPISGHQIGRMPKDRLMVGHCALEFMALPLTCRQDPIARDEATFDLIEHQVSPKLDRRPWLLALQHAGMRLEEADDLLLRGDL